MENQENKPQEHEHYEDEIDLRDYINVLIKRKWAIAVIFMVTVVAAAVISLLMSPTYEATSLIRVGQIKNTPLETPSEIKEIFARRAILKQIAEKLALPDDQNIEAVAEIFSIKTSESADLIKINGYGETPEKSVEVSNTITNLLIERHQKIFSEADEMINLEVDNINKNKEKINKDIVEIKNSIARLDTDIKKYEQEISKRGDIQTEGQGRIAESYINLLASVKNQKEAKEATILNLEQSLLSLDQSLKAIEYEKTYQTMATAVEIPAISPQTRISPNRKQNVMIAGIIGIFVGIFYAFTAEYFGKEKNIKA
jgi:capsular polysaccharide biosynthesis protein